jgi:hypothetical protein
MTITAPVRDTLTEIGQVAAELHCPIEGYREFVSIYATARTKVMNCEGRFPNLDGAETIYRAIRFRVNSALIDNDSDVGPNDLVGLQEIFLPSEEGVEFVLSIWKVNMEQLLSPREVDIPV